MVMDDLVVKPMSTISSITMLNKFNVKEVGVLEEKMVSLEMKEGLMLLKASFQCKNVLTCVFLS
ncbi:pre-rRNA-processing protein TSR2-like protein, partial [Tanacetum coccineum]